MDFVHLHLHTEYSLLDGACRIGRLFDAVKKIGQSAVAITDHGVMYGAVDFYKEAKKHGVKPIIGCEVYVAASSRHLKQKQADNYYNHLILLCKNETGYKNLIKLVSLGFTEGFYNKPRVDKELLEKYNEGLICLSACLAGEIPMKLLNEDYDGAKKSAEYYNNLFGRDNFYLELQNHSIKGQAQVNSGLLRIHNETGIPLVATNDVHYINREDSEMQRVLMCIQTGKKLGEDGGLTFETDEFYLKSAAEMEELFSSYEDAISNTVKIAGMCNFDFEFGKIKIPKVEIGIDDHFKFLKDESFKGLYEKYTPDILPKAEERLNYELSVIDKMGYVDYYLIVRDFVMYAKNNDIPVGPGRGSGAGSIAAYCLGITGIDPLKYGLLFERFLNPERVSMPDFDIDFCYIKRQKVIDYVIEKYGSDRVAQIVTFGTMAARNAIRDAGRVMDISYALCDKVAKLIPLEHNATLDYALKTVKELKNLYDNDPSVKRLINMAIKIEGMPRHASTHAAGVVISDKPVSEYVPLSSNDESIVTQYTMNLLDELGLLKIDFLGLRNLTVIDDTVKKIRLKDETFDINKIDLNDKAVLKMMGEGNSEGVFQFESAGMRSVLRQFKPETLEDLIAIISLYRPGPMDSIPKYINNRFHPEDVKYPTPLLKPILDITYGCIVYQEQVMQVFRSLAGYSLGRADIVRRAMAKKKKEVMEKERNSFIYGEKDENGNTVIKGAANNGIRENDAKKIFDDMAAFSSYAFNKSHAAAYGYLAYQTAYLKYHYPTEYMAALLTSVIDNTSKVIEYTAECNRLKISILPPDVNKSFNEFSSTENGIRFGLLAIKNLGRGLINNIIREREENGEYTSVFDFCTRNRTREFTRRAFESLIKSGALDSLSHTRRSMMYSVDAVMEAVTRNSRFVSGGQMNLFSSIEEENKTGGDSLIIDSEEYPEKTKLQMEKEVTGLYLTGHPLKAYSDYADFINSVKIKDVNEGLYSDKTRVFAVALISDIKTRVLKSGSIMCTFCAEDLSGQISVTCFEKTYETLKPLLLEGSVLKLTATVSEREDRPYELLLNNAELLPDFAYNFKKPKSDIARGMYIKIKGLDCSEADEIKKVIGEFKGDFPVYFYIPDEKKKYIYKNGIDFLKKAVISEKIEEIIGKNNIKTVEK